MACRMPDLGAPEVMVLVSRIAKAWPAIVRHFLKFLKVVSLPPSLVVNSAVAEVFVSTFPWVGVLTSIE